MRSRIWIALGVLALAALSYPVLASVDSGGRQVVVPVTPDGGLGTHEQGYVVNSNGCLETTCLPGGDGGVLSPAKGQRYQWTVTSDSPVRVRNGAPCVSFAGGTGEIINEGAMLDQTAQAAPDGGTPAITCCSKSGTPVLQLCPMQ